MNCAFGVQRTPCLGLSFIVISFIISKVSMRNRYIPLFIALFGEEILWTYGPLPLRTSCFGSQVKDAS